jgi:hypothetical protein
MCNTFNRVGTGTPTYNTGGDCDMADAPADMAGGSSSSRSFRKATWTRRKDMGSSEDAIDLASSTGNWFRSTQHAPTAAHSTPPQIA